MVIIGLLWVFAPTGALKPQDSPNTADHKADLDTLSYNDVAKTELFLNFAGKLRPRIQEIEGSVLSLELAFRDSISLPEAIKTNIVLPIREENSIIIYLNKIIVKFYCVVRLQNNRSLFASFRESIDGNLQMTIFMERPPNHRRQT